MAVLIKDTIVRLKEAGVDRFVCGSAIGKNNQTLRRTQRS